MFAPSQKAQDEASGCDGYEARLGLMDRLRSTHVLVTQCGWRHAWKGAQAASVDGNSSCRHPAD
jgi:hypothetical protein